MSADWLIDLGHSRIKWARRGEDGSPVECNNCPLEVPGPFEAALAGEPGARLWLSAQSTIEAIDWLEHLAGNSGCELHRVQTGAFDLPVKLAYAGLGCDRWLALQWPWLSAQQALCVVDCGTAVTVDVVDDQGQHLGGWIMSGLASARDGLLARARNLPRDTPQVQSPGQPATSTAEAIAAGTLLQLAGSVERGVDAAGQALGRIPQVWITGGDAAAIMPLTRTRAVLDEHLVLRGLAIIAELT